MTPEEKLIWKYLNRKQLGFWFKRQVSIGPYFVDFYCPQKRLVVELDGIQHYKKDQPEYDKYRTEYLTGLNMQVVRFKNTEVAANSEAVVQKIKAVLQSLSP